MHIVTPSEIRAVAWEGELAHRVLAEYSHPFRPSLAFRAITQRG
jgi:hypothetical protein